jgi:paraquat-inducible protein A
MSKLITAAASSLINCPVCRQLNQAQEAATGCRQLCCRCGSRLSFRKPNSIARSWALTLTALILYIPANILPVMTVISYGRGVPDTILSGVIHLIRADMYPIALLVFFASIVVPLLKLIVIIYLLISIHRQSSWHPRERTVIYRITENIGRWSMLDIFVIGLLAALVQLGSIATIEPGIGAISFAGVVVTTILAAESFDPRLIWDAMEENNV